ncbi:hypothetical protein COM45_02750 [Corynebacterium accolens]|uniref:SGNH hydrolase-type esterase domain-containing protein n=1 Tax=Corynebacterium accolens TaxID=38284 RepID=A0A2A4AMQ6_9CORY|nr:hypothetical protein COM45_02750 [Corynebacterium accolens]
MNQAVYPKGVAAGVTGLKKAVESRPIPNGRLVCTTSLKQVATSSKRKRHRGSLLKKHKILTKLSAVCAAVVTTAALGTAAASAQQSETVLFGDSIFANPTFDQIGSPIAELSSAMKIGSDPGAPSPQGCPQGASNVGRELGRASGQRVINYACSGATAAGSTPRSDFVQQVNHAVDTHTLNPGTRNVLIQFGFNDVVNTNFILDPNRTAYKNAMRNQINRIRAAAPNAKITLVGYPAFSAANGSICPIRIKENPGLGANLSALGSVRTIEDNVNHAMFQAAQENHVDYFDLRSATIDHNMCAPTGMRWMGGVYEFAEPHNFFNHLTHSGNVGVARILSDRVLAR